MLRIIANTFYVVEILRWNLGEHESHARNTDRFEAIVDARWIELTTKILQELPAFCVARFLYDRAQLRANMLHMYYYTKHASLHIGAPRSRGLA